MVKASSQSIRSTDLVPVFSFRWRQLRRNGAEWKSEWAKLWYVIWSFWMITLNFTVCYLSYLWICMGHFLSSVLQHLQHNPAAIWDWFTFCLSSFLFFNTDLDGREISPPCHGVSTLKPWKTLRWKMRMAKIYPWFLLLFVWRKFSMHCLSSTYCSHIQHSNPVRSIHTFIEQDLLNLWLLYSSAMCFLDHLEHFQNLLQWFPWSCAAPAPWRRPLCALLGSVHCKRSSVTCLPWLIIRWNTDRVCMKQHFYFSVFSSCYTNVNVFVSL